MESINVSTDLAVRVDDVREKVDVDIRFRWGRSKSSEEGPTSPKTGQACKHSPPNVALNKILTSQVES